MKTTVVNASELGDDWTPAAHMPRALTEINNVQAGDTIRVRDHRRPDAGEGPRRWHLVTVKDVETDRSTVLVMTNRWPIAYMASADELVELVDIRRTVDFRCVVCSPSSSRATHQLTVTLDDFVDADLMKRGKLHVTILPDVTPRPQTGYCREHGTELLA